MVVIAMAVDDGDGENDDNLMVRRFYLFQNDYNRIDESMGQSLYCNKCGDW